MIFLWKHKKTIPLFIVACLLLFTAPLWSFQKAWGADIFFAEAKSLKNTSPYHFESKNGKKYKLYGIHFLERDDDPVRFRQADNISIDFVNLHSFYIEYVDKATNRHGYFDVILWDKDKKISLQEMLLEKGLAKIDIEDEKINDALFSQWKEKEKNVPFEGFYRIKNNATVEDFKFQIVRDTTFAISERQNFTYINFDKNWREDFTIMIPKAMWQRMDKSPFEVGKTIQIRGFTESYYGPIIKLNSLRQID